LTGENPFQQYKTHLGLIRAYAAREVPTQPRLSGQQWEEFVWQLMTSCWDYDPLRRPRAEEILAFFSQLNISGYQDHFGPVGTQHPRRSTLDDRDLKRVEATFRVRMNTYFPLSTHSKCLLFAAHR
jgi:hypothetical protein